MTTMTAEQLADLFALDAAPEIIAAEERHSTPVLTGQQRQGDVLVAPLVDVGSTPDVGNLVPVDDAGILVLAGGNDHVLTGRGPVFYAGATVGGPDLGMLTVGGNGVAWLEHTGHHAPLAIGAGTYLVCRQRTVVAVRALDSEPEAQPLAPLEARRDVEDPRPRWQLHAD